MSRPARQTLRAARALNESNEASKQALFDDRADVYLPFDKVHLKINNQDIRRNAASSSQQLRKGREMDVVDGVPYVVGPPHLGLDCHPHAKPEP